MAAFYDCKNCGREFLGPDDIPIEDETVEPTCYRCQYQYVCGMCGDFFTPTFAFVDGVMFTGSADYCPSCYTLEQSLYEEIASYAQ